MSSEILSETTQFLTFTLAEEVFAVEISQVKEVLEYTTMTKVPRVPGFMRGVINLRGSVVPVVDMRLKFGMPAAEITVNTCIIIIEVSVDDERVVIGAMADSVKEVMDLEPNQVEPAPRIGAKLRADFIRGMGKQGDHFIILLNTDRVFSFSELELLQQTGSTNHGPEQLVPAMAC